jgi:hypothetical protein
VPKKNKQKDIAYLVKQLGDVVKLEDCFDVPEQIYKLETFSLTSEQKTAIINLPEEGIALWTAVHQICGGTLKSYDETFAS